RPQIDLSVSFTQCATLEIDYERAELDSPYGVVAIIAFAQLRIRRTFGVISSVRRDFWLCVNFHCVGRFGSGHGFALISARHHEPVITESNGPPLAAAKGRPACHNRRFILCRRVL